MVDLENLARCNVTGEPVPTYKPVMHRAVKQVLLIDLHAETPAEHPFRLLERPPAPVALHDDELVVEPIGDQVVARQERRALIVGDEGMDQHRSCLHSFCSPLI